MTKRKPCRWALAALGISGLLGGCGGTVQFSGSTPFEVTGALPAPVPEAPQTKRVVVTEDAIVIHDKIHFEFDKATIKPESFDLLNEIATVINDNPRIERINIEGHTDAMGSDEYNQQLSAARSESVRKYLVEHGVVADRLTNEGFGESRPIASNDTDEGRQTNRRVEFIITAQKPLETVYEVDVATGERHKVSGAGMAAKKAASGEAERAPGDKVDPPTAGTGQATPMEEAP